MVTGTAAEVCEEAVRPKKRNRCVQRTVDLNEPEIAAVAAAEVTPDPQFRSDPRGGPANT
jgi:hypothetical protein